MYIAILIINMLTALVIKKNNIIPCLSFIYLGILAGQTDLINNRDTFNYYSDYMHLSAPGYVSRFEWLYVLCEKLTIHFSLTYEDFRLISMVLGFIVLFFCVKFFVKNVSMFYILFALFVFPLEATQVRTFLMFVCFVLALRLVSSDKKLMKFIGCLVSFLAPGFHSIGYFFVLLILIIVIFKNDKKLSLASKLPFISVGLTCVMILPGVSSMVGTILSHVVGSISANQEITENIGVRFNNNGTLVTTTAFMFVYFLIYFISTSNRKIVFDNDYIKNKIINVRLAIAYIFLAVPLLTMSGQYQRILRYGILLMFIYYIESYEFSKQKQFYVKDLTYIIGFVIAICLAIVLFYGIYASLIFMKTVPYLLQFSNS